MSISQEKLAGCSHHNSTPGVLLVEFNVISRPLVPRFLKVSTMKTGLVIASIAASASAFAPAKQSASVARTAATKSDLEAIAEKANPIVKFYDPLNLAEANFYGMGNEATIGFLRQSEIKVTAVDFLFVICIFGSSFLHLTLFPYFLLSNYSTAALPCSLLLDTLSNLISFSRGLKLLPEPLTRQWNFPPRLSGMLSPLEPSGKSSLSFLPSNSGTNAVVATFLITPRAESLDNTLRSESSAMKSILSLICMTHLASTRRCPKKPRSAA
jgi:hypothetical protein